MERAHATLKQIYFIILSTFILLPSISFSADKKYSDEEIRQRMISESIAAYSGNCPCPYNIMRNGKRCGKFSAYIKPGGYSPLCYPRDITDEMVKKYRERMK